MSDQMFDAVIVTGSRFWTDEATIAQALVRHLRPGGTVIHGDCAGADRIAAAWSDRWDCDVIPFPFLRGVGPDGGPIRNTQMLNKLLDVRDRDGIAIGVLAFHDGPKVETAKTGGTADMLRKARARGVPVVLVRSPAFVSVPMLF